MSDKLMKTCERCGARWMGGQHYWSTGLPGNEYALNNLVCNLAKDDRCINPKKKDGEYPSADSWAKREAFIRKETENMNQKFGF